VGCARLRTTITASRFASGISEFLALFFGDSFDAELRRRLGWSVADAVRLARSLNDLAAPAPRVVPFEALVMAGMDRQVISSMLPFFAHKEREANRNYRSPSDATGPDIIFKPLILFDRQFLLLPTASVLGPALFEATFVALKASVPIRKFQFRKKQRNG
jgi:hypothetical protein